MYNGEKMRHCLLISSQLCYMKSIFVITEGQRCIYICTPIPVFSQAWVPNASTFADFVWICDKMVFESVMQRIMRLSFNWG